MDEWPGCIHHKNNCFAAEAINLLATTPFFQNILQQQTWNDPLLNGISQSFASHKSLNLQKIKQFPDQEDCGEFLSTLIQKLPADFQRLFTFTRFEQYKKNPIENSVFLNSGDTFTDIFNQFLENGDLIGTLPPNLIFGRIFSIMEYEKYINFTPFQSFTIHGIEYNIYSMIFHHGSSFEQGHYVSYSKKDDDLFT